MKKITNYFKNLPKGVKIILKINIVVYLLCFLSEILFSYDLIYPLSIHATNDSNFMVYHFITNMFTHDILLDHIIFNMLFFIIFSVSVENKIGTKNFILLYLLGGIIGSILCDFVLRENYLKIISEYQNLKPRDYTELVAYKLRFEDNIKYNNSYGASGSVSGIMITYILLNILNWKKLLFNIFILFFVYKTIVIIQSGGVLMGTFVNHFGGMVGGLIVGLIFLIMKNKNGVGTLSTPKYIFNKMKIFNYLVASGPLSPVSPRNP